MNKLVLKNHFPWPNATLLYKDKEHLALKDNFRVTKKFLIAKFDCITKKGEQEMVKKVKWHRDSMHDVGFEITNFVTLNLKLKNPTDIMGYVVIRRTLFGSFPIVIVCHRI